MKPGTRSFYELAVERVVAHLVSHLDEAADLEALAGTAGLSPYHFHRIFRGMVGETPLELLRRLRLERGPYNQIGKAFEKLGQIAGASGLFAHPGAAMIATYHDDPDATPPDELRSEAGIIVPENVPLPAALAETHIPEGDYAKYTHIGPFDGLGPAWQRLMGEWVPASGRRLADSPSFEIYRSDMRTTPKEELRTDIYVPLA